MGGKSYLNKYSSELSIQYHKTKSVIKQNNMAQLNSLEINIRQIDSDLQTNHTILEESMQPNHRPAGESFLSHKNTIVEKLMRLPHLQNSQEPYQLYGVVRSLLQLPAASLKHENRSTRSQVTLKLLQFSQDNLNQQIVKEMIHKRNELIEMLFDYIQKLEERHQIKFYESEIIRLNNELNTKEEIIFDFEQEKQYENQKKKKNNQQNKKIIRILRTEYNNFNESMQRNQNRQIEQIEIDSQFESGKKENSNKKLAVIEEVDSHLERT